MNPVQDHCLDNTEIKTDAVELSDQYCEWSAIVTVQHISQNCKEDKDIRSHLGMGQPSALAYQDRPRRAPKENHRKARGKI